MIFTLFAAAAAAIATVSVVQSHSSICWFGDAVTDSTI
jgi:hypothetical protein